MAGLPAQLRKHEPQQLKQIKQAVQLMRSGESAKAQTLLESILTRNPNIALAHLLLGNVHYKQDEYQEALAEYQQALELNPQLAPAPLMMGLTYRAMDDPTSALSQFERSLELKPDQVSAHLQMSRTQLGDEQLDAARESLQKALAINPQSLSARLMAAELNVRSKEYDQAAELLKKIVEERPEIMVAHQMLGLLYTKIGRAEEAKACFETVVRLTPDRPFGHLMLGNLRFKLKEFSAAEQAYRGALALNKGLKAAQYRLADTLVKLNRLPDAIALLKEIARASPRRNSTHQRMAAIHAKQGNFAAALHECSAAIRRDPAILKAAPELGTLLTEPADREAAVRAFLDGLKKMNQSGKKTMNIRLARKNLKKLQTRRVQEPLGH